MSSNKKKDLKDKNLMELIPVRNYEYNKKDDGLIDVLVPRFTDRFFGKYLQPRMKNKYIRANLDIIGTFTWEQIDGTNTVYQISENLKQHFGEEELPQHVERLATFISQLFRNNFIHFKNLERINNG